MQISINGFVAGPEGEMDWLVWNWDDELKQFVNKLGSKVDTILIGRKMTDGFISHWTKVSHDQNNPEYEAGQKFVNTPKVVFSKTLESSTWANTTLDNGELIVEVNNLKNQDGNDIMVYGGANFVSNLIEHDLIDEYNLFVNPVGLEDGMSVFNRIKGIKNLKLLGSRTFECGITLMQFARSIDRSD